MKSTKINKKRSRLAILFKRKRATLKENLVQVRMQYKLTCYGITCCKNWFNIYSHFFVRVPGPGTNKMERGRI